MLRRLNKFFRLSSGDQALLLDAFLLVLFIRIALWTLPFQVVRRQVARRAKCQLPPHSFQPFPIQKLTSAIEFVAGFVPMATCLTQALAAEILLARSGYSAVLRIGVSKQDTRFKAHAWIEANGFVVIGDVKDLANFQVLPGV